MGANLSLLAPHAHTVAIRLYVDVLPNYKYLGVANNTRFLKTLQAYDSTSKTLIIVKVFIKPPQANVQLHHVVEALAKEALLLAPHPCLLGWSNIIETDSAGYLVRQAVKTNLYDRLLIRPFLAPVEKVWLVFQLLKIVELLHDHLHVCHGDIKLENVLVTGANWLLLTDFSQHIKPVHLLDDSPSEFVFYFDSSNRRSCYVAPERFFNKHTQPLLPLDRSRDHLSQAADLFSLGCVIAELYSDGAPTFTLSDLFRYRKGELSPNLSGILDPYVAQIVRLLISLDPAKRPAASELLSTYKEKLFPLYLYDFVYDFMASLNSADSFASADTNRSPSDLRIDSIYSSFAQIALALGFEYNQTATEFSENTRNLAPVLKLNLGGLPADYVIQPLEKRLESTAENAALIFLDVIFSLVLSVSRPESKIKACHLILALSEHISDEHKLDRSLPYVCSFIDEFIDGVANSTYQGWPALDEDDLSTRVACTALVAVTNLLATCTTLTNINAHVFLEFLLPKLKSLTFLSASEDHGLGYLKLTLTMCFPYLAQISEKFSHLARGSEMADRSEADIKDIAEALLTSSDVNVRINLVKNIFPLCQYFGVDKTNDIILPHLITYFNDSNYQLRLAFLDSIMQIGSYIGVLAFEQYLLPLLMQTLCDSEPFVVLKVLEIFCYFVRERLINPKTEFNALSTYKELLSSSMMLLLQPNEWIRHSVMYLILGISDNLLNADRFCFLYPLIQSYLVYDIADLSWDSLYSCVTKPISRQVFDLALVWQAKSNSKSLFWKQAGVSLLKANGKRQIVPFTKDMGKSVYIGRSPLNGSNEHNLEASLSPTDRQWVLKMKSVGLDEKNLWKIFALKHYFLGINRSANYSEAGAATNFELAAHCNIPPKTVLFEVRYKAESLKQNLRWTESSYEAPALKEASIAGSVGLSYSSKAKASLLTNEANVFGEMDTPTDEYHRAAHPHHGLGKDSHVSNRVFSVSDDKYISATMQHDFHGTNPHVVAYLDHLAFEPTIDDFPEFGSVAKPARANEPLAVGGIPVAQININAKVADAVTKVAVCPTSEFFVTGTKSGQLRVWDSLRLETTTARSARLSRDLKSPICEIVFMPNRLVFAVATKDGQLRLFRVFVVRGKNHKIVKYSKMALIRSASFGPAYATCLVFSGELCVCALSSSRIVGHDVIRMERAFELKNPAEFGVPTSIIAGDCWLIVGTSGGFLTLWDVRFKELLRSWSVRMSEDETTSQTHRITKLVVLPKRNDVSRFAMIGGSHMPDISIWEIPSFECVEIYTAENLGSRKYYLEEVKDNAVDSLLSGLNLELERPTDKSYTALAHVSPGYVLALAWDKRIFQWNLADSTKSAVLGGDGKFLRTQYLQRLRVTCETLAAKPVSVPEAGAYNGISDLAFLAKPYHMIIAGHRDGRILVYK